MKKSDDKKRNKEQEILAESKKWESGRRGSHSAAATDEDENVLSDAIDLQMISIRQPSEVISKLKAMAKKEGIGYQHYTRQLLIHHTQGESSKKLHDLEERLQSVEKIVLKKVAGR